MIVLRVSGVKLKGSSLALWDSFAQSLSLDSTGPTEVMARESASNSSLHLLGWLQASKLGLPCPCNGTGGTGEPPYIPCPDPSLQLRVVLTRPPKTRAFV